MTDVIDHAQRAGDAIKVATDERVSAEDRAIAAQVATANALLSINKRLQEIAGALTQANFLKG